MKIWLNVCINQLLFFINKISLTYHYSADAEFFERHLLLLFPAISRFFPTVGKQTENLICGHHPQHLMDPIPDAGSSHGKEITNLRR